MILENIVPSLEDCKRIPRGNVEYTASLPLSDIEETNTNSATAALRMWKRLKGVQ